MKASWNAIFFGPRAAKTRKRRSQKVGLAECAGRLGRIKEGEDRRSDSQNLGFGRSALEGLGRTSNREFSTPSRDGRRIASRIPPGHAGIFHFIQDLSCVQVPQGGANSRPKKSKNGANNPPSWCPEAPKSSQDGAKAGTKPRKSRMKEAMQQRRG